MVKVGADTNGTQIWVADRYCSILLGALGLIDGKDSHYSTAGAGHDPVCKVPVRRDEHMSW